MLKWHQEAALIGANFKKKKSILGFWVAAMPFFEKD